MLFFISKNDSLLESSKIKTQKILRLEIWKVKVHECQTQDRGCEYEDEKYCRRSKWMRPNFHIHFGCRTTLRGLRRRYRLDIVFFTVVVHSFGMRWLEALEPKCGNRTVVNQFFATAIWRRHKLKQSSPEGYTTHHHHNNKHSSGEAGAGILPVMRSHAYLYAKNRRIKWNEILLIGST